MKNVRSILYCCVAVIFSATAITSCKDGEDGEKGKPGSVITIGDNCHWYIDGVDTGEQACAHPGSVITIGDNGNWYINGDDTRIPATGADGTSGTVITIGENGNWYFDNVDTEISALGSVITIGDNGNWWIDGKDTEIAAGAKPNVPPVANFSWAPDVIVVGDPVQFSNLSVDEDGYLISWVWQFGEVTSTQREPEFTFESTGAFEVSLTVTDDNGAMHTKTQTVVVSLYRIDREGWSVKYCNSWNISTTNPANNNLPEYVFDGDFETIWHSNFATITGTHPFGPLLQRDPPPHTLVLDFGEQIDIVQLEIWRRLGNVATSMVIAYIPAVDEATLTQSDFEWLGNITVDVSANSLFPGYVYTGVENSNWTELGRVEFPNADVSNKANDYRLMDATSLTANSRYLKLIGYTRQNGNVSLSEVIVITKDK